MPRLPAAKIAPSLFAAWRDRKSTRLNSSHDAISYAVFCLEHKRTRTNSSHDADSSPLSSFPTHRARLGRRALVVPHDSIRGNAGRAAPSLFFFLNDRPPPELPPFPPPAAFAS